MDFKAGMFFYALAFLLGIVFVQQMAVLPEILSLLFLFVVVVLAYLLVRYLIVDLKCSVINKYLTLTILFILLFLIGLSYASFYAKNQLESRLSETLAGQDILLSGVVATIPTATLTTSAKIQRFEFAIDSFDVIKQSDSHSAINPALPQTVRLSWYYGNTVNAGERWQLLVRLKPPHGFINPGGFDYERWLFQQNIHATGYIRKSELNKRLAPASHWSINRLRQMLGQTIDVLAKRRDEGDAAVNTMPLIKALAIGDKSSITTEQWDGLRNTGTSHLMAISGLHIGLAALFIYVLIRRILPEYLMKRVPAQHIAVIGGMVVALLYALVAGFSIPTQRAVIMLFTLSVMLLIRRNHRPLDALGLALVVVLLIDPLAVLSAGFWFSFSAVAVIFISVSKAGKPDEQEDSFRRKIKRVTGQWLKLQLMISLFLLPLSLYMFQQASLVSPLANLLLIPYVSFLVVPLVLLAIVCWFFLPVIADMLFNLAATLLDFIWPLLQYLAEQPYAYWIKGDVDLIALLLVTSGLFVLYFSTQLKTSRLSWASRGLGVLLLLPLGWNDTAELNSGEFRLTILDVGQGSAAVIQTKNHRLVFDTGAKFSDRMNVGASVVVPYLRYLGDDGLDRLIISHGDNDHIGGAQAVIDAYPNAALWGQDIEDILSDGKQACRAGDQWHWDGVDFKFLAPLVEDQADLKSEKRNNRSCVLRVASPYGSSLFTGDIEGKVERRLLERYGDKLSADILMVPHHGSNTSSTRPFIATVDPEYSIISVGYRNRYKLPNAKVMARYEALKLPLVRTDSSGAIMLKVGDEGIEVERYRDKLQRYWHHKLN